MAGTVWIAVGLALVTLGVYWPVRGFHQEYYWKDSETFNERMIEVTAANNVGHSNLGLVFDDP
jgi:hypothetical protein